MAPDPREVSRKQRSEEKKVLRKGPSRLCSLGFSCAPAAEPHSIPEFLRRRRDASVHTETSGRPMNDEPQKQEDKRGLRSTRIMMKYHHLCM